MPNCLRVLIVEDSEDDALLMVNELECTGYKVAYKRVQTAEETGHALARDTWDLVLADFKMPRFSGNAALKLVKDHGLDMPFILVSGKIGEETAVEAMKAGAHDYVMKDNLTRLVPAVQRELREAQNRRERKRADEALHESEFRFRQIYENAPVMMHSIDERWSYPACQLQVAEGNRVRARGGHRTRDRLSDDSGIGAPSCGKSWRDFGLSERLPTCFTNT